MKNKPAPQVALATAEPITQPTKNNLSPENYMQSLLAANLSIDEILTKICAMKWEQEVLDKFLKRYSTNKILSVQYQLQINAHDSLLKTSE